MAVVRRPYNTTKLGVSSNSYGAKLLSPTNVTLNSGTTDLTDPSSKPGILLSGGNTSALPPPNDVAAGNLFFDLEEGVFGGIIFGGVGSDNTIGCFALYGYRAITSPKATDVNNQLTQYKPFLIANADFILSANTGMTGGILTTSFRFVDVITIHKDYSLTGGGPLVSPPAADAANISAFYLFDNLGYQFYCLELRVGSSFGGAGSAATSVNAAVFSL